MKKSKITMQQKRVIYGFIFISPWLIGLVFFFLIPITYSIRLSFSKITQFGNIQMQWSGFDNYIRALVQDVQFVPIFLKVVQKFVVMTPLIVIFSLIIAVLINKDIRAKGFFREVFFLPVLLGTGFVMQQLLGQKVDQQAMEVARGILLPQEVLLYMGPTFSSMVQGFLNSITMVLWKSGVQIVIFLAGLQSISKSLYESSHCDGATEWEMFWKITFPMISPVILLNSIYTVVDSFTDVSNPVVEYIMQAAFKIGWKAAPEFEYAAAISWIYLIFVFTLTVAIYSVIHKRINDSEIK